MTLADMAVLIVDDSISIRFLLLGIIEDMGIDCLQAASGEEALAYLTNDQPLPILVVLDIGLPGIDGYETGRRMKAIARDRHLPIIFLTGAKDTDILSKCLAIGDDYIAKPFSADVVSSKVEAHRRVSELYQHMEQRYKELKVFQHHIDQEHKIVENIFANHFEKHISQTENFRYHISPTSVFNGDVLLTAQGPFGNLYIAIGDVTGHGLPAAVGAIPVYPAFRSMAIKGISIGKIAAEMNRSLRDLLPENMLLAVSLLEFNSAWDILTVWSGGMPAMVLADSEGNIKQLIEPTHCPLAMLHDDEFSQDVQVYKISRNDRLYLFTDGVEESRNSADKMFGEARLHSLFDGSEGNMFDRIIDQIDQFAGDQKQDDDITLVEVICAPIVEATVVNALVTEDITALPWSLYFELSVDEIKLADPVLQVIRLLSNAVGVDVHQDYISTVLSELYSNALDHGLLELDSRIKDTEDGFLEYYSLRSQRLNALQDGSISIHLNFIRQEPGLQIEIVVKDSGAGFDYQVASAAKEEEAFGRGIDLVRGLCDSVEYSEGGSCVKVIYSVPLRLPRNDNSCRLGQDPPYYTQSD
ncbi:MAG: fused response regulator/phosphatase [Pseudomonadales bacterium]